MEIKTKQDIEQLIAKMSVEEKVGQTLVIGFNGSMLTSKILRRIAHIHPAGVRTSTVGRSKCATSDKYGYKQDKIDKVVRPVRDGIKYFVGGVLPPKLTNEQYCENFLNVMKRTALENGAGIPLHITLDMEGDGSCDYNFGGCKYFPNPMGMTKSGDTSLPHRVGYAVAKQVTGVGFSWIHSPVADINTDPENHEIGTRSFGESAKEALPYLLESFRGLREGGLICTAKHFPGRGASNQDAHHCLPVVDLSREELEEHLSTFKALVDEGVPCVMTAHSAYPALDDSGLPATLSKKILTVLLKNEWGFKGVVTTDDITMGGIVDGYNVDEACIMAINAGCDLILFRDEACLIDEVYEKMVDAAKRGEISEERLNDAVRRTLNVKLEYGLFEDGAIKDPEHAGDAIRSKEVAEIAREAAEKTTYILRDEENVLPLDKSKNILLVEQIHPVYEATNDYYVHPSMLWEKCQKYLPSIQSVEVGMKVSEVDEQRVFALAKDADIIVCTNFYLRRSGKDTNFAEKLLQFGKPVVVITNTPYKWGLLPSYKNVIMEYAASAETMDKVARLLFEGK